LKKTYFFSIAIFLFSKSYAGNENFPVGARAAGIGNAAVTLNDMWAAFHNQAGTAYLEHVNVGVYNEIRYGLSELSLNAFAVAVPVKDVGTFSLSATYFGYKLYNEQKIGLAYARKFGDNISAGLQFNYIGTNISDEYYGNKSAFTVEAGFRAVLLPKLILGVHIYNPTRAKLADYTDERIPTVMKLGLCYHFNDKVLFAIEAEKASAAKNIFKAGIEYQIAKPLYLRAGIATNQTAGYFGFGLSLKQIKINFTASFHETLGFTPHTDLSYEFGKQE